MEAGLHSNTADSGSEYACCVHLVTLKGLFRTARLLTRCRSLPDWHVSCTRIVINRRWLADGTAVLCDKCDGVTAAPGREDPD